MYKQELNRKLAEWAGFTSIEVYNDGFVGYTPVAQYDSHIPLFTQSLDACFKWLVPKAREEYPNLSVTLFYDNMFAQKETCRLKKWDGSGWQLLCIEEAECPALALCLAIEKLIDRGGK